MELLNMKALGATHSASVCKVLRNTYFLLSLTLIFSTVIAMFSYSLPAPNLFVTLIGILGLPMLVRALSNSAWGLAAVFLFSGFFGYIIGPIVHMYTMTFTNGVELVATSLGATAMIFLGLSTYVLTTGRNFSYLGGMIFAVATIAFLAGLCAIFFQLPTLHLVVSAAFALIASASILFHTSMIIHGGERNYIMATINLYIALFNLFLSLLRILSSFAGERR